MTATSALSRAEVLASSGRLSGPIEVGRGPSAERLTAMRMRRYLVLVAVAHIKAAGIPAAQCTRELVMVLTKRAEARLRGFARPRGVNTKAIQRDPVCDRLYRFARGLPPRPRVPLGASGLPMDCAALAGAIAACRRLAEAHRERSTALGNATDAELREVHAGINSPMPLERRIATYAPPVVAKARRRLDADLSELLRTGDLEALVTLHEAARGCLDRAIAGWRQTHKAWALRIVLIHREWRGLP